MKSSASVTGENGLKSISFSLSWRWAWWCETVFTLEDCMKVSPTLPSRYTSKTTESEKKEGEEYEQPKELCEPSSPPPNTQSGSGNLPWMVVAKKVSISCWIVLLSDGRVG